MNTIDTKFLEALRALKRPNIKWDRDLRTYVDCEVSPTVIVHGDQITVSAEGSLWADYYGEFGTGLPTIDPQLEDLARSHQGYWEWVDPGSIAFVQ
jgi:hypothetical protein